MKNSIIQKFETKVASNLAEQKNTIAIQTAKLLEAFETIELIKFGHEQPYRGELKNKIFFTYSDHYRGNSGTNMSVGHLGHPHIDLDDRGYIKGVATDLDGYMKLREAKMVVHIFDSLAPLPTPKFRRSKYNEQYTATCNEIVEAGEDELIQFRCDCLKVLNEKLNEMTGCSLLHYLRSI